MTIIEKANKNFINFATILTSKNELLAKAINGINFQKYSWKIYTS